MGVINESGAILVCFDLFDIDSIGRGACARRATPREAARNWQPSETRGAASRTAGPPGSCRQRKLVLSLDDSIRAALSNNTDIRLDRSQIEFAQDNLHRTHGPFDPLVTSSFADSRAKSPTNTQIQGAPILDTLIQTTTFGYAQAFQTGTHFQTSFNTNKLSTNDSLSLVNPSLASNLQFTFTQPLLRKFGLFPNRAPILIAQQNLNQARAIFRGEVNDIILRTVGNYWNVVLARDSLTVQRKSLEEAQKSYDHDKKALSLGALPPLDIYRSESQVASRRVGLIQAEYSLKQAADQFRRDIGA